MTSSRGNSIYRCANYSEGSRRKGKKCGHCAVKREQFEQAVFAKIRSKVLLDDRERLEAAIAKELARRSSPAPQADKAATRRQMAKLDSQIEKATEQLLLIDADILPAAQDKLRELKARRAALEHTAAKPAAPQITPKLIADQMWALDEVLRTAAPVTVRHATREGKPIRKRRYAFSESFAAIAYGELAQATGEDRYYARRQAPR